MANYLIEDSTVTAIADAIRSKDGTTATIKGSDIAARIGAIVSGGAEFYGCPIETGTVVVNHFTVTIPHSLGTVKGIFLLNASADISIAIAYIPDEINLYYYNTSDYGNTTFTTEKTLTNENNSVTFGFEVYLNNVTGAYSYILLGA